MSLPALRTPVALILFNRPDTTARVFAEIARAQPPALFLIADGPRPNHPTDRKQCAATRGVVERIDWKCEVVRKYSEANLGCKAGPVSGIHWVFDQVTTAIILEDDCLPDPSFFPFCQELLDRYRDDARVMTISGDNFQFGRVCTAHSYYFSVYPNTWGWATWRRAWHAFNGDMHQWPGLRDTAWLEGILGNPAKADFWRRTFDTAGTMNSVWDYQWLFSCWLRHGLSISPSVNLVSNIGFGETATHTADRNPLAGLPRQPLAFPLSHPSDVIPDRAADEFLFRFYAAQGGDAYARLPRRLWRRLTTRFKPLT